MWVSVSAERPFKDDKCTRRNKTTFIGCRARCGTQSLAKLGAWGVLALTVPAEVLGRREEAGLFKRYRRLPATTPARATDSFGRDRTTGPVTFVRHKKMQLQFFLP